MARYNFFISHSHKDMEYVLRIAQLLVEKGYSVLRCDPIWGEDYFSSATDAIANCDCFLPIITEAYFSSNIAKKELEYSLNISKSRAQVIIPICVGDSRLISYELQHVLRNYLFLQVNTLSDLPKVVEEIDRVFGSKLKSSVLYEKLAQYKKIENEDRVAETICDLLSLTLQKWENLSEYDHKERLIICKELYRLYTELGDYTGSYDEKSKKTAELIVNTIDRIENFLSASQDIFYKHIYFVCIAIRILYLDRSIREKCEDIKTEGKNNPCPINVYISKQASFVNAYNDLIKTLDEGDSSKEDISFVKETKEYIFDNKEIKEKTTILPKPKNEEVTENDEVLLSIAKFMQEGNKLFDVLQSKGIAGDFLKCLLTSYERLRNYCNVVGAKNVAADCVDRIVEIRNAIEYTDQSDLSNEKAEKGIKSLLGFTLVGSGNYDVFISFKSEDSDLAERIYNFCQQNLKVPFWSKRTLPQLSKSEYEDAIYDALRKSKHFVIVLSSIEYLKANWIKREMSTFDRAITEGRKENGNFVFVVTDDVYKTIIESNKECLDERYCGYQIIKMSEYEETLMSYIV